MTKFKTTADPKSGVISIVIGNKKINTGTTDRTEARRLMEMAAQMAPTVHEFQLGAKMTVKEAVAEWKTWMDHAWAERTASNTYVTVNAWANAMKVWTKALTAITEKDIEDWVNEKSDVKASSRRIRLSSVRSLFKFCVIKRYLAYDPSRLAKVRFNRLLHKQKEPAKKRSMTEEELNKLHDYLTKERTDLLAGMAKATSRRQEQIREKVAFLNFWTVALAIGRYTGLRLGDVAQLEWDCLSKPGKIIVWTDKVEGTRVELKIDPALQEAFALVPPNSTPYLFPEQQKMILDQSRRAMLSTQFSRLCAAAKIGKHSYHGLRSHYAMNCLAKGIKMPHISANLGHSSTMTTVKHYIRTNDGMENLE